MTELGTARDRRFSRLNRLGTENKWARLSASVLTAEESWQGPARLLHRLSHSRFHIPHIHLAGKSCYPRAGPVVNKQRRKRPAPLLIDRIDKRLVVIRPFDVPRLRNLLAIQQSRRLAFFLGLIGRNRQQLESLTIQLLRKRHQLRQFFSAGVAPGGPESTSTTLPRCASTIRRNPA